MDIVSSFNFVIGDPKTLNATPLVASESNFKKNESPSPTLPQQTNSGNEITIDHNDKADACAFDRHQLSFNLQHEGMHHVKKGIKHQCNARRLPRRMKEELNETQLDKKARDAQASPFKKERATIINHHHQQCMTRMIFDCHALMTLVMKNKHAFMM